MKLQEMHAVTMQEMHAVTMQEMHAVTIFIVLLQLICKLGLKLSFMPINQC